MNRYRTPHQEGGMDNKEFYEQLDGDISEYAKKQAIGFAEWIHVNNWRQEYLSARWYRKMGKDGTYTIDAVYALFLIDTNN